MAVTAAAFLGFTGFTLVMPSLPLYFRELGLTEVGQITWWTGLCIGITPGLTAVMAPIWGRLASRVGRKLMVERSLLSFVVVMIATAYVTAPWQVLALRTLQGFFAGYAALAIAMAAESVPTHRLAFGVGVVQTAQRLGPAFGPVIGGAVAELVGVRRAFIASSVFYLAGFLLVLALYREPRAAAASTGARASTSLASLWRLPNFALLWVVIFAFQFIDRSFGPVLTLYVEQGRLGERVVLIAGLLFTVAAFAGAFGNVVSGWLLRRTTARRLVVGASCLSAAASLVLGLGPRLSVVVVSAAVFGFGIGLTMTTAFAEAGREFAPEVRAEGFGMLTSASLVGMAVSGPVSGLLGAVSIRAVFAADVAALLGVALLVGRGMSDRVVREAVRGGPDVGVLAP